jgi:hypothetical protein
MDDPTRRSSPGSWPRDRPVRWRWLASSVLRFVVGTGALLVQLALVVPLLMLTSSATGRSLGGLVGVALALAWGGLTLFAAWSWVVARWRVVLAPIATIVVFWLAATLLP